MQHLESNDRPRKGRFHMRLVGEGLAARIVAAQIHSCTNTTARDHSNFHGLENRRLFETWFALLDWRGRKLAGPVVGGNMTRAASKSTTTYTEPAESNAQRHTIAKMIFLVIIWRMTNVRLAHLIPGAAPSDSVFTRRGLGGCFQQRPSDPNASA